MAAVVGTNQYGLDAEMYTGQNVKARGETMVQKHLEKLQAEKENFAIEKLSAIMPHLGAAVRVVALQETQFDVDQAVTLLRKFHSDNDEQLKTLHKKRSRLVQQAKEAAAAAAAAKEDESTSGSSDSHDSGSSDSDSSAGHKRKRSRRSKNKRDGKHKKRADTDKKRKKKKKKESKAKPAAKLTSGDNFGKYGIIREIDFSAKSSEFILWALEVKKVDCETLPKNEEKELFKDYIEDYNTGTLPHRKYYNLEAYDKYKEAKRAAKGIKKSDKKSAVDDEEELRKQRAEEAAKLREQRMKEAYNELKYSDKAKDMKEQEMLRLQMQTAYKTGDVATAQKIMERLLPDDQKPK